MTATDRFRIVAPLPSPRGHLHLAVDQASSPPRAVVLAFYPRAISDDPARLERLAGEMERVAQLFHPNVLAPMGIEAVGADLAAVTGWRDAVTLREVLDAGGRLPHDIAARIAADVCAGLAHAHGRKEPVVHGLLRPDDVLVDESGTAAVSGFGMPGGSGLSDDLLAVGELLHELLVGEPPAHPTAPLDAPGIPSSLAAVVNQARAEKVEARFPTAEALGKAIAEAIPLASHADVAAYLEAIVPAGAGLRAQRRKRIEAALGAAPSIQPEEISEQDIVCAPTPAPGELLASEPQPMPSTKALDGGSTPGDAAVRSGDATVQGRGPSVASTSTCPTSSPARSPTSSSIPSPTLPPTSSPGASQIFSATSSTGSATSSSASTSTSLPTSIGAPIPTSPGTPSVRSPAGHEATRGAILAGAPVPATEGTASPSAVVAAPAAMPIHHDAGADRGRTAHHDDQRPRGRHVSLPVAVGMAFGGLLIGFALARLAPWGHLSPAPAAPGAEARASADAPASAPMAGARPSPLDGTPARPPSRTATAPAPKKKRSSVRRPAALDQKESLTALLDVTAPDGAEIWLDGRRIGTGSTRRRIPEGVHRVEVRHRGAKVGESFHVAPGETWTYSVTPK